MREQCFKSGHPKETEGDQSYLMAVILTIEFDWHMSISLNKYIFYGEHSFPYLL